jgi:hypothetical protein
MLPGSARQAMEDLREVLGVLQTDLSIDGADLAPVPRATDLTRLVEASRAAGVNLTSELILPSDVPVSIGHTVYRIVQESLTQARRDQPGQSSDPCPRCGATRPVDSQKGETGRALPRGVGGGSSTRPVSDQRPRGVDAEVMELYTRPKYTLLVQIFALATGRPGLEECHSMFPPA